MKQEKITERENYFKCMQKSLSSYNKETKGVKKHLIRHHQRIHPQQPLFIQLNKTEKDGFYLETTKNEEEIY